MYLLIHRYNPSQPQITRHNFLILDYCFLALKTLQPTNQRHRHSIRPKLESANAYGRWDLCVYHSVVRASRIVMQCRLQTYTSPCIHIHQAINYAKPQTILLNVKFLRSVFIHLHNTLDRIHTEEYSSSSKKEGRIYDTERQDCPSFTAKIILTIHINLDG